MLLPTTTVTSLRPSTYALNMIFIILFILSSHTLSLYPPVVFSYYSTQCLCSRFSSLPVFTFSKAHAPLLARILFIVKYLSLTSSPPVKPLVRFLLQNSYGELSKGVSAGAILDPLL